MSELKNPKVSVGLAVYNGERYLEESLDSILAQTFTDFELIICDNASTDRTAEICHAYAERDARIRYFRNERNIGGANNGNLTFQLARGEYFRWAADDDVCEPELLEKCVAVLDNDPAVILCHSIIVHIDGQGNKLQVIDRDKASSASPSERLRTLYTLSHDCEAIYGLVRASVLRQTSLQRNYTDSDRTLLCHLSLYGLFHQIREPLFRKRMHSGMSTQAFPDWRARMAWFGSNPANQVSYPYWLQFLHYLEIFTRSPLSPKERTLCYLAMIPWVLRYKRWLSLGEDILLAGRYHLRTYQQKLSHAQ